MRSHHPNAAQIAADYIGGDKALEVLGWGVDGVVYTAPGSLTAVKIHNKRESFAKELAVYRLLRKRRVSDFMGFQVPRLMRSDARKMVLELSVVKPPFLLDFAAATLCPLDFTDEVMDDWWQKVEEDFGDDFPTARDVFHGLKRTYGIYYWDLKPRNLRFR